MKSLIYILAFVLCFNISKGQKLNLSDTSYKTWTEIYNNHISADGRYADYQTITGADFRTAVTTITSTDKIWSKQFISTTAPTYTKDGHYAYLISNNKLLRIQLSTDQVDTLGPSTKFEIASVKGKEYLLYQRSDRPQLCIYALNTKKNAVLDNVLEYWKNDNSGNLVVKQGNTTMDTASLKVYNLFSNLEKTIFSGSSVANLIFNDDGTSVAFTTDENEFKTLWFYRHGMKEAKRLISEQIIGSDRRISFNEFYRFSDNSEKIIFSLEVQYPPYKANRNAPDIWNYQDKMIYPKFKKNDFQLNSGYGAGLSLVDVNTGELTRLLKDDEKVIFNAPRVGDMLLIEKADARYLVNTITNQRQLLQSGADIMVWNYAFSPNKKLLVYFDGHKKSWMCYNIINKSTMAFAESITKNLLYYDETRRGTVDIPLTVFGWVEGTDRLIMQGTYDLYDVSVTNAFPPKQLTSSANDDKAIYTFAKRPKGSIINKNNVFYIYSQNLKTRVNTLYKLNMKDGHLEKIYAGDFFFRPLYDELNLNELQVANDNRAFLLVINTVKSSRNFLFTRDFKTFTEITDNHPESAYNWMTSEIISYRDEDGKECQGILYKPENFDPRKKYPVVFTIYQEQASTLNKHITPIWNGMGINIPYLVSNGYLVCKPNIYYAKAKIGQFAVKGVLAAASYLSQLNYVDSTRFGINGHSLGGFETQYVVTHSNRFAAAIASNGVSNMINHYNDFWGDGADKHDFTRFQTLGMWDALEDNLPAYIDNSPILHSKDMNTPLLLMHGEIDDHVPFYHSAQMFNQLRSIGKKVWLISYENENHSLTTPDHLKDCNYRILSFFDYYLMGKPEPEWMKKFIPFEL